MEGIINWLPFVATGIYTIIYLWVIKVQKARIESSDEINKKMERFMNSFDLDKVEKYGKLIEKIAIMETNLIINDNELIKNRVSEQIGSELRKATHEIDSKITDEYIEAMTFIKQFAGTLPLQKQINLVENFFPKSKSHISEFLDISAHIKNKKTDNSSL